MCTLETAYIVSTLSLARSLRIVDLHEVRAALNLYSLMTIFRHNHQVSRDVQLSSSSSFDEHH
jgi:hypothetical protein